MVITRYQNTGCYILPSLKDFVPEISKLGRTYPTIQALKNGNFANDLGFRRNHFCWIRDVKLFLGFKFHNFSNQYLSVAKENAFDQF